MTKWLRENKDVIVGYFSSVAKGISAVGGALKKMFDRMVEIKGFAWDEQLNKPAGKPFSGTGGIGPDTPGWEIYNSSTLPPTPQPSGGDMTPADGGRLAALALIQEQEMALWIEQNNLQIDMEKELQSRSIQQATEAAEEKLRKYVEFSNVEIQIERDKEKIKEALQKATMRRAVDDASFFFKQMGEKSYAAFEVFKAIEIAKTVVNTYSAAMGAYNAMASIPYIGPALGVVAAAAALAAGFAQVDAIRSMTPGGGGGGGGAIGTYSASPATGLPTSVTDYDTMPEEEKRGTLTINIHGDILGDEGYIDMLVDKINAADDRDVFINQSLSARELA